MKGLELSLNLVAVAAVGILVLVIVSFFFSSQSSDALSDAEANEIFFGKCDVYKRQQCDWKVTYQKDFSDFYDACKHLNGPDIGKFTCLYKLCCASSQDVQCDGLCELCNGQEGLGVTQDECCQRYRNTCSDSPSNCGVCGK